MVADKFFNPSPVDPYHGYDPEDTFENFLGIPSVLSLTHIRESNRIEGITDEGEIPKSIKAWNYLSAQPLLTSGVIKHVHRIILEGLLPPADAGEWRRRNVMVGGRMCPHWAEVPDLMSNWITNGWTRGLDKLLTKEEHVRFETIHPFIDGNGRVGRMLMWYHEGRVGRYPLLIRYEDRFDYYDWFPKP